MVGAPDLDVAPPPRRPPPACSPATWSRPRRCRSAAGTSPTAAPRRWCSTPATPTRRRGSRVGPTRCACASSPRRRVGCATTDVLVCQTGLIGIPMPMDPVESGVPKLGAQLSGRRRRRRRRGRRHAHHRHRAQGDACSPSTLPTAPTATVGGMAKGAAMLAPSMATMLAVLTTDVAVAARAAPARARSRGRRTASTRSWSTRARAPTTPCSCSPTALAGNPPITDDGGLAYDALVDALTAACADLAHQMAADAEGATKCVTPHGAGRPQRRPRRSSRRARSRRASSCSARSTARTRTGAGSSPSSA